MEQKILSRCKFWLSVLPYYRNCIQNEWRHISRSIYTLMQLYICVCASWHASSDHEVSWGSGQCIIVCQTPGCYVWNITTSVHVLDLEHQLLVLNNKSAPPGFNTLFLSIHDWFCSESVKRQRTNLCYSEPMQYNNFGNGMSCKNIKNTEQQ